MIYISHRGNINGPNKSVENNPDQKSKISHFYEYTTLPPKKTFLKKIRVLLEDKLKFNFI